MGINCTSVPAMCLHFLPSRENMLLRLVNVVNIDESVT